MTDPQSNSATHIGANGRYYKQRGKFWYVLDGFSWRALSGDPTVSITAL